MSNTLKVVTESNVETFDEVTLNPDHRLDFEDGELTAVYPENADETEYRVAMFPITNGTVELPDGAAVLDVTTDTVVALVPEAAYRGD